MTQTTRRAILAGIAAAIPAAAVAAPALAAGHDPDAELVRLWREWRELYDLIDQAGDYEGEDALDDWNRVTMLICTTPAHGLRGLAVKAKLAAYFGTDSWNVGIKALVEDVLLTAGAAADPDIIRAA